MKSISNVSKLCFSVIKATLIFFVAFFFLCSEQATAMGRKEEGYPVSFKAISVHADSSAQLNAAVWYPSKRSARSYASIQGWSAFAPRNISPVEERFPVILISHDVGMHRLSNADLAKSLASSGFVVISVNHHGESFNNLSSIFSAASFYHRPRQLSAALDVVLQDEQLGPILDHSRIGILGVGSGAVTALQLGGVDVTPVDYPGYCDSEGAEALLCSRWAVKRLQNLLGDMDLIRDKYGRSAFTPFLPGVGALALMSPGWMVFVDKNSMASLKTPLAVLYPAVGDTYFRPERSEDYLAVFPPRVLAGISFAQIEHVDHYSLNAPCSPEQMLNSPGMCSKLEPDERGSMVRSRDRFFVNFFQSTLGIPVELKPASSADKLDTPAHAG